MVHLHAQGFDDRRQWSEQVAVHFHRRHVRPGLHECQRQRSQSGADFKDLVARTDLGEARNAPHGVGVDDEVLSQGARGFETILFEQRDELGAGVGHQVTRTGTTPTAKGASSAN